MLKNIFDPYKNIFGPCLKAKLTITHFKQHVYKKIIFFCKICINFPHLKRSPQKL